jgi:hypothetical protein
MMFSIGIVVLYEFFLNNNTICMLYKNSEKILKILPKIFKKRW